MAIAAEVRTKRRRLMLNLRRQRSTSRFCRSMIAICVAVGGGGMYSSFDAGRTSTGGASPCSGPVFFHLITALLPLLLNDLERASHRRVDAAEVRDDLPGRVALRRGDRDGPLSLVLDTAD